MNIVVMVRSMKLSMKITPCVFVVMDIIKLLKIPHAQKYAQQIRSLRMENVFNTIWRRMFDK